MKQRKVELVLSRLGIYTGLAADLIAIIPAIVSFLQVVGLVSTEQILVPAHVVFLQVSIPVKAIVLTLIFYGYVMFFIWLKRQILYPQNRQDMLWGIRGISIASFLLLGFPFVMAFVTFGDIKPSRGLSLAALFIVMSASMWRSWHFKDEYWYHDIGPSYLLWIPWVSMFLFADPRISWWWGLLLGWFYSSVGYLFSLIVVVAVVFLCK